MNIQKRIILGVTIAVGLAMSGVLIIQLISLVKLCLK